MHSRNEFISSILFENGPITLKIIGNSMYPTFHHNQNIAIRKASLQDLHPGMCCVYFSKNSLILHRILWISKRHLLIAGDANPFIEKIDPEEVIAIPVTNHDNFTRLIIFTFNLFFLFFFWNPSIFRFRKYLLKLFLRLHI
jgi:signal peptidase I